MAYAFQEPGGARQMLEQFGAAHFLRALKISCDQTDQIAIVYATHACDYMGSSSAPFHFHVLGSKVIVT